MLITFLSDFGLEDGFVGVCHGVIEGIAPGARVIDIAHGIPPRDVVRGALVLASAVQYMPEGVHLAVVDPGVGGPRRALALRDAAGRLYVGPDNGLLMPAAERLGGISAAHELAAPRYMLQPVSATFHGRDVFAPAAAHLAAGVSLEELGPELDPAGLVRLELPLPVVEPGSVRATVLAVDRFGNVALSVTPEQLGRAGIGPRAAVEIELGSRRAWVSAERAFVDASSGELILYEDSSGRSAVAVSGGDAAALLGARPGVEIRLRA